MRMADGVMREGASADGRRGRLGGASVATRRRECTGRGAPPPIETYAASRRRGRAGRGARTAAGGVWVRTCGPGHVGRPGRGARSLGTTTTRERESQVGEEDRIGKIRAS